MGGGGSFRAVSRRGASSEVYIIIILYIKTYPDRESLRVAVSTSDKPVAAGIGWDTPPKVTKSNMVRYKNRYWLAIRVPADAREVLGRAAEIRVCESTAVVVSGP